MTTLAAPEGIGAIVWTFGSPAKDGKLDLAWYADSIRSFALPYPMRLSWGEYLAVRSILAHRLVGPLIVQAESRILETCGYDWLREHDLDFCGGCFNFRDMVQYTALSTHAWGIAIDRNPAANPYGKPGAQPAVIVDAYRESGFDWGGRWFPKWKYDAMHFQLAKGY